MFIDSLEFNNSFSPLGIQNFYAGKVVDNADPKKLGRVKVAITEIFGVQDKEKLPWCTPFMGSPAQFDCPEIGDILVVYFPYGIAYFPCYFGHWNLADNHDTYFDADYPNSVGFHRQGFGWKYNKTSKEFEIIHPEGSSIKIKADGAIELISNTKIDINSTDDISFNTEAEFKVAAEGGAEITTDGDAKFAGKGSTELGDNSSQTMVNGTLVIIAQGGLAVAVVGSQGVGLGNLSAPVLITIISGSSKVFAPL